MPKYSQVKFDSLAKLKASLQKDLRGSRSDFGDDESKPEPPNFAWLKTPGIGALLLLVEGADVVLGLDDGRVFVGTVKRSTGLFVTLALWGCGGQRQRFPVGSVAGASVVGPHSYESAREVKRRQRAGEPALVRDSRSAPATERAD